MSSLTPPHEVDIDGDSTMHSSPDLAADDDEMFPDEAPSTPKTAAAFALDPTAELSPPNSQGGPSLNTNTSTTNGKRKASKGASGEAGASTSAPGVVHTDPATGYKWDKQEDQPGYEWKNNRAREDEVRALEQIVDKGSQIKRRYGDPLKAEVPMTLGR